MPGRNRDITRLGAYAEMIDFPCTKQEMLQMAEEQDFPDDVLNLLEDVPNRLYTCESDLIEAAAGLGKTRVEVG